MRSYATGILGGDHMKRVFLAAGAALLLASGCTVQKEMVPTGGSRSDGTVNLSYEYGLFERPQVNASQAEASAQQRCEVWGYTGAEPFGGALTRCEAMNGYGECLRTLVTVTYQCTGNPTASGSTPANAPQTSGPFAGSRPATGSDPFSH